MMQCLSNRSKRHDLQCAFSNGNTYLNVLYTAIIVTTALYRIASRRSVFFSFLVTTINMFIIGMINSKFMSHRESGLTGASKAGRDGACFTPDTY